MSEASLTNHPIIHHDPSLLASQAVTVDLGDGPVEYWVEDWWDRVAGMSWMVAQGNPAAMSYAVRAAVKGLPIDDAVLYGKVDGLGHLVHVSEVTAVAE